MSFVRSHPRLVVWVLGLVLSIAGIVLATDLFKVLAHQHPVKLSFTLAFLILGAGAIVTGVTLSSRK